MRDSWIESAAKLSLDGRALCSGRRVSAISGRQYSLVTPRDGREIAIAATDRLDVERAVSSARRAERDGTWSRATPEYRREVLLKWADLVEAAKEELALLISLEMGKPIRSSLSVELRSVVRSIRWYAEIANKLEGRHPNTAQNSVALVRREPAGVVAIILPWNFPLSMVGYDVTPALVMGNSVIVKPSEQAPLSVLRCCELAIEAGIPPDVLSVLPGLGTEAGAALGLDYDVDVVVVTGSVQTGRAFLSYSAQSNAKRTWLKLGGKSTFIVCKDAPSLEAACNAISWGAYFNQGQMCTGASRILVDAAVAEDVLHHLQSLTDKLVIGDPLSWNTDIGPLASAQLAHEGETVVSDAITLGATLRRGGASKGLPTPYFSPTLLSDLPLTSRLFREEVFAPIAGVHIFDSLADALETSKLHGFGMGLSLWTSSLTSALEGSLKSKVGTCWINCFEADDLSVPFGGVKRSGYGRDKSTEALEKYSDLKTTWIQLDESSYW